MKKNDHQRIHRIGFDHAWEGIVHAFKYHGNMKIHFIVSLFVICLGYYFNISSVKWVFLVIAIGWGLAAELFNTAIESVVDLITEEWKLNAKIAKDVSSGAVLISAIGAATVGMIIFVPEFIKLVSPSV